MTFANEHNAEELNLEFVIFADESDHVVNVKAISGFETCDNKMSFVKKTPKKTLKEFKIYM